MKDAGGDSGGSADLARPRWRRVEEWHLLVAMLAGAVLVRSIGDFVGNFVPMSDVAIFETRAYDVFSRHPPLVGMLSTASDTAEPLYHPGPILFWLMALPVRLADRGRGLAVGMGIFNAACLVASVWASRRFLGRIESALVAVILATLVWSLGVDVFHDAWLPHASIAPFFLLLVCGWGVALGQDSLAPWLVVAWSLAAQIHGSTFVVGSMIAVAAAAVRWLPPTRCAARTRPWLIGGLIGVVLWLPPLIQQIAGSGRGNLLALAGGGHPGRDTFGFGSAVRIVGTVLASPPWWLRPGVEGQLPQLGGQPDDIGRWSSSISLIGVACLLVVLGLLVDRALDRRDRVVVAGGGLAICGIIAALIFVSRIPIAPFFGFMAHTVRWLWPLGAFLSAVLCAAVVRRIPLPVALARSLTIGLGVTASAAALVAPELDIGPTANWRPYADRVLEVREAVGRWHPDGVVHVQVAAAAALDPYSDAVVAQLAADGVHYVIDIPMLEAQLDSRHWYRGVADWRLYRTTLPVRERDGLVIVAEVTGLDQLSGAIGEAGSGAATASFLVAERRG